MNYARTNETPEQNLDPPEDDLKCRECGYETRHLNEAGFCCRECEYEHKQAKQTGLLGPDRW